jgi:CRISPR-associated protein Cas2
MLVVISYDIPHDGRRNRLARLLKGYGERMQYSVFEAELKPEMLRHLKSKIATLIEPAEDSVRIYRLGMAWKDRIETLGLTKDTALKEEVVL